MIPNLGLVPARPFLSSFSTWSPGCAWQPWLVLCLGALQVTLTGDSDRCLRLFWALVVPGAILALLEPCLCFRVFPRARFSLPVLSVL